MTTPRRQRMPRHAERYRLDAFDYAGELRGLLKEIGTLNTKIGTLNTKVDDYANTREELRHDIHREIDRLTRDLDRLRLQAMDFASQIQLAMTLAGQGREPEEEL
jgi:predicted  nucleic acid-binding Zn-ribbon protein